MELRESKQPLHLLFDTKHMMHEDKGKEALDLHSGTIPAEWEKAPHDSPWMTIQIPVNIPMENEPFQGHSPREVQYSRVFCPYVEYPPTLYMVNICW